MPTNSHLKIGQILLRMGALSKDELERGVQRQVQESPDQQLGYLLVAYGVIREEDRKRAVDLQLKLQSRSLRKQKAALDELRASAQSRMKKAMATHAEACAALLKSGT